MGFGRVWRCGTPHPLPACLPAYLGQAKLPNRGAIVVLVESWIVAEHVTRCAPGLSTPLCSFVLRRDGDKD